MRFQVEAFDYLGKEIFAAQSPEVQNLLVKSALVPFFDPELMRGLTGVGDAEGDPQRFGPPESFCPGKL